MKKIPVALFSGALFAGALLMPEAAKGCGPFFQPSYLRHVKPYSLRYDRTAALKRLVKLCDDMIPVKSRMPKGIATMDAVKKDVFDAVKRYLPDMNEADRQRIADSYSTFVREHRFDFDQLPVLPEELEEFKLYRTGVKELYDSRERDFVPPSWTKLLQLPPEKRHYRTVWVYFMMGNHTRDPKYYEACREAVRNGFADTPGLGRASYINEFVFNRDPVHKLHVWAEAIKNDPEFNLMNDLRFDVDMFHKCSDKDYARLLADPLGREVLAVFGNYNRVPFIKLAHTYKFRNADIIAYYYYRNVTLDVASQWLKQLEKPTLLSLYLEARIARINGNTRLAAQKLHEWLKMAEKIDPAEAQDLLKRYNDSTGDADPLKLDVYGLLGNTMVLRRDFVEAAVFFYNANQMESDLAIIAERYLSLDELIEFTEYVSKDAPYNGCRDLNFKVDAALKIRHLTARRAFREGRMDVAEKYMPKEYLIYLDMYQRNLAKSRDKKYSNNERALALYNAAKIMRFMGMELCGTEIEPDNHRYDGDYYRYHEPNYCNYCKYDPVLGTWKLCQLEYVWQLQAGQDIVPGFNAVKNYNTVPLHQRWHYRYRACDMALTAAEMAENPELKALIYYFGGNVLRKRSPKEADVFYKLLVRNCRKTKLGDLADKTRWFPVDNKMLLKEVTSVKPCASVYEALQLMKTAFAEK